MITINSALDYENTAIRRGVSSATTSHLCCFLFNAVNVVIRKDLAPNLPSELKKDNRRNL